ncbi:MAG: N-acetylglucosamine-6-phosphate deacetylase [Thermomicrobiales bacterium]|nr:N-acetylglucosamine-6-phosphate deacetylase [Thermomicrobiales bacterium]
MAKVRQQANAKARTDISSCLGRDVFTGQPIELRFDGPGVVPVTPIPDDDSLPWIGPGLVDLQVNGYGGIDLNAPDLTVERVIGLTHALLAIGVTAYLPTLVTDSPEAIEQRLNVIARAIESDSLTASVVAGIHLEGPFISPEDGARGAHPLAAVRGPDWGLFERWQSAAGGRIRIVTLSPEWPEAPALIAQLRAAGVIAAIGHTAATSDQIQVAIEAGATMSTHLGNAAHPVLPRHPNYIWEQLAADELTASFIGDGFHLPRSVMKTIMRMKGDAAVLVSDSVALAGMPPGEYDTPIGAKVVLTEEGRLHLQADPRLLAGSAQPLIAGIGNLVRSGLATLADAWAMASVRPVRLLGPKAENGLAVGAPADIVQFRTDEHHAITIEAVWKHGELVVNAARGGER